MNVSRKILNYITSIYSNGVRVHAMQALPFWIASLIVGLLAVLYTRLFGWTESLLRHIITLHPTAIFFMSVICFLAGWLVVRRFAPNARGSGIPQVMAAIDLTKVGEKKNIKALLSVRIIIVKIVSSLLLVLGGASIGREGPTIQIAGSVFTTVRKWFPASWPKLSTQSFILTGAACGLAAAFNTPLGGLVFAVEELSKIHIRFFRTALFSAIIIAGLTAQAFLGPYLYLGYPDVSKLPFSIFLAVAATALVTGFFGSLMCKGILNLMRWRSSLNLQGKFGFVVACGLVTASLAFFISPDILGSGKNLMSQWLFTDVKYNVAATPLLRVIGTAISFSIGGSGGVFAPSLAAGAAIGSSIAHIFDFFGSNANILMLSGMVGFLTGVTRTPFTSAILVLEMTDRHNVIFHLLLAALLSNIIALLVDKESFYERLKKQYLENLKAA